MSIQISVIAWIKNPSAYRDIASCEPLTPVRDHFDNKERDETGKIILRDDWNVEQTAGNVDVLGLAEDRLCAYNIANPMYRPGQRKQGKERSRTSKGLAGAC